MMNGADAADQVVKYTLEGTEVALKLSGLAAKNIATYMVAVLNDQKKTSGKTTLVRMLREGKPLNLFQLPTEQLKDFAKEAKRFGVLFVAVKDKNGAPTTVIMVFKRDAQRVDRIVDRLKLAVVEAGEIGAEQPVDPFVMANASPSEISLPSRSGSATLPGDGGGRQSVRVMLAQFRSDGKKLVVKDGKQLTQAAPHLKPKAKGTVR